MKIGSKCFNDRELRNLIESGNERGLCDVLGGDDSVYDTEKEDNYLAVAIKDSLYIFDSSTPINKNIPQKTIGEFFKDFHIFNININATKITEILENIFKDDSDFKEIFTKPVHIRVLNDEKRKSELSIIKNDFNWEKFANNIKYVNRFHSKIIQEKNLEKLINLLKVDFPKEIELYRGRICKEEKGYEKDGMWAPPKEKAAHGRINAENIRCFYLTDSKETVMQEIRAVANDRITIAKFRANKNIKDLWLVNFNFHDNINIYGENSSELLEFLAVNIEIINDIITEIAKPLRSFDNYIEYIPMQFISDYIKFLGGSGVIYKSIFNNSAKNYAIFCNDEHDEKEKFECLEIENVDIKKVGYELSKYS